MTVPDRFRSPHFAPLWSAVHERLSTGQRVTTVSIPVGSDDEKLALAGLLDLTVRRGARCSVRMTKLDAVCRESAGIDARAVVTELLGPVGDRAGDLAANRRAKADLWAWVREHPVVAAQPALLDWVAGLRVVDGSVVATRTLLTDALAVLAALPATGRPLPEFAQQVLHDPHALDDDRRLAGIVLRGLAAIHGIDPPGTASDRHALWEQVGVSGDLLSVTVLVAGLRAPGDGLVPALLRTCADAGHAASLTLAQVRAAAEGLDPGVTAVWAVENPAVVALALDRFGTACPPLVCTAGWPNGAATLLLRSIATDATVRYHGDLDGEGLRIAAHLATSTGAVPWRMTAVDYRAAVHTHGPPVGRVTDAPWDPELAPAMVETGVAVPEEQVAAALLDEMTGCRRPHE